MWSRERIRALKNEIEAAGLNLSGIESVNVHDSIKIGNEERDKYIDNYIETLENLGKEDIHLVCYNFMPVFDWTRTELARVCPDGSTAMAYKQSAVDALNPETMFEAMSEGSNGTVMPGWEPERMAHVKELFELYKDIDEDKLLITSNISSSELCRSAMNTTSRWRSIPMILHGPFSVCPASSPVRRTSNA